MKKYFKTQSLFFLQLSFLILCWSLIPGQAVTADKTGEQHAPNATAAEMSEKVSSMTDIFDIKSPVPYPGYPSYVKWLVGVLAGILIVLMFFVVRFVYQKKIRNQQDTAPPVPPDKAALAALRDIRKMMDINSKDFYFALSMILRSYINGRFHINAEEMTTEEILSGMTGLDIDPDLKQQVTAFFRYSDFVKFADMPAERVKMEKHLKFVNTFVKTTSLDETETS